MLNMQNQREVKWKQVQLHLHSMIAWIPPSTIFAFFLWTKTLYLYCWAALCWAAFAIRLFAVWVGILNKVTGRFWTSCLQTSHILFPLMLNHLTAQSWCARASSPLQLHSILSVSPPSLSSTKQILQTASSSGISSPPSSGTVRKSTMHFNEHMVLCKKRFKLWKYKSRWL